MTKTQRLELEELSLRAYGTKTRYKKLMEKGLRMELKDEGGRVYQGYYRFEEDEVKILMEEEIEERRKKTEEKLNGSKSTDTNP